MTFLVLFLGLGDVWLGEEVMFPVGTVNCVIEW